MGPPQCQKEVSVDLIAKNDGEDRDRYDCHQAFVLVEIESVVVRGMGCAIRSGNAQIDPTLSFEVDQPDRGTPRFCGARYATGPCQRALGKLP